MDKSVYMFQSSAGKRAMLNYSLAADLWLIRVEDRFDDVLIDVFHSSRKTLASAIDCLRNHWPKEEWRSVDD